MHFGQSSFKCADSESEFDDDDLWQLMHACMIRCLAQCHASPPTVVVKVTTEGLTIVSTSGLILRSFIPKQLKCCANFGTRLMIVSENLAALSFKTEFNCEVFDAPTEDDAEQYIEQISSILDIHVVPAPVSQLAASVSPRSTSTHASAEVTPNNSDTVLAVSDHTRALGIMPQHEAESRKALDNSSIGSESGLSAVDLTSKSPQTSGTLSGNMLSTAAVALGLSGPTHKPGFPGYVAAGEYAGMYEVQATALKSQRTAIDQQVSIAKKAIDKLKTKLPNAVIGIFASQVVIHVAGDELIKAKLSDFAFCGQASVDHLFMAVCCKYSGKLMCFLFRGFSSPQVRLFLSYHAN
jgi:hypothetical protein